MFVHGAAKPLFKRALEHAACTLGMPAADIIVDDGDLQEAYRAVIEITGKRALKQADRTARPLVYCQLGRKAAADFESLFGHERRGDFNLERIARAVQVPPPSNDMYRRAVVGIGQILRTAIGAAESHGRMVGRLWDGYVSLDQPQLPAPTVYLIDDREDFAEIVRTKVRGTSLNKRPDFRHFGNLDKYLAEVQKQTANPVPAVDIFLVDIVDAGAEGALAGLDRVLPRLKKAKGLRRFPQILMLSNVPAEQIAALCHAAGADYYIDKNTFAAHPDAVHLLEGVLWHNTNARDQLKSAADAKFEGPKWTNFKTKPVAVLGENGWSGWSALAERLTNNNVFATEAFVDEVKMVVDIFETEYAVDRIDLLEVHGVGLSGARTLSVRPWSEREDRDGDGKPDLTPMAPRIVKIDFADKMTREWAAYHDYVATLTTESFARIEHYFLRRGDRGALSYTLAGSAQAAAKGRITDCHELLLTDYHPLIGQVSTKLFRELLVPLHECTRGGVGFNVVKSTFAHELAPVQTGQDLAAICDLRESTLSPRNATEYEITEVVHLEASRHTLSKVRFRPVEAEFPVYTADCKESSKDAWTVHPGKRFMGVVGTAVEIEDPKESIKQRLENFINLQHQGQSPKMSAPGFIVGKAPITALTSSLDFFDSRPFYARRLQRIFKSLEQRDTKHYYCVVHGDLNLRNVICSEETQSLWLIDFARTRDGLPALDYVAFEMAIRAKILAPILGTMPSDTPGWAHRIHTLTNQFEKYTQADSRLDRAFLNTDLPNAGISERNVQRFKQGWQLILETRQIAFEKFYRGTARDIYDATMTVLAMRAMQKYDDDLRAPFGPVAIIWACSVFDIAYKDSSKWPIADPPEPVRTESRPHAASRGEAMA